MDTGEHHYGCGVPHYGRKVGSFQLSHQGPKNHPVRTYEDRRTHRVERDPYSFAAVHRSACKSAPERYSWVSGSRQNTPQPDHAHRIKRRIRQFHNILIAGNASPIVVAGTKDRRAPLVVHPASAVTDDGQRTSPFGSSPPLFLRPSFLRLVDLP
jgi:hypothetical protein